MSYFTLRLQQQLAEVAAGERRRVDDSIFSMAEHEQDAAAQHAEQACLAQERAAEAAEEALQVQRETAEALLAAQTKAAEAAEADIAFRRKTASESLRVQRRLAAKQMAHARQARLEDHLKTSPCFAAADALKVLRHWEGQHRRLAIASKIEQLGRDADAVVLEDRKARVTELQEAAAAQLAKDVADCDAVQQRECLAVERAAANKARISAELQQAQARAKSIKGTWLPFSQAAKDHKAALEQVANLQRRLAQMESSAPPPSELLVAQQRVAASRERLADVQSWTPVEHHRFKSGDDKARTLRVLEQAGITARFELLCDEDSSATEAVHFMKDLDTSLCLRLDHVRASGVTDVEYPGLGVLPFGTALVEVMAQTASLRSSAEDKAPDAHQCKEAILTHFREVLRRGAVYTPGLPDDAHAQGVKMDWETQFPVKGDLVDASDYCTDFGADDSDFGGASSDDDFDFDSPPSRDYGEVKGFFT